MGLIFAVHPEFGTLDIQITPKEIASPFVDKSIEEKINMEESFSNYKIEFYKNVSFAFHLDGKKVSLRDAVLEDDGLIVLENKKVQSTMSEIIAIANQKRWRSKTTTAINLANLLLAVAAVGIVD